MLASKLQNNDAIGIVSPSAPVTNNLIEQFNKGIDCLTNLGFKVKLAKNTLSGTLGYPATPKAKAKDINSMFADNTIKAIICSQGGTNANSCLPFLDWQVIKENPKIFLGISDITVLLNAIYSKTGLITFHGNDVIWGFGRNPNQYDIQEFINRLLLGKIGSINNNGLRTTVREGVASGKLLGGNINCLLKLAGTPYLPDFENSILFIESFGFEPDECECRFNQLKQMGIFEKIKGIIVGFIYDEFSDRRTLHTEDILLNVCADYAFPILKVNDFGHNCPNTVIPVGVKVKLDATKKEIEILENCIK